jgi:hypothetical protein
MVVKTEANINIYIYDGKMSRAKEERETRHLSKTRVVPFRGECGVPLLRHPYLS